ncbi:hypothetical protein HB943_05290 [Listeria weihenstephanensis]|uniref:Uncharacterized protein n=1 Tax=Listeria weihenstephanensis TaxID=1006155 RepID=A0A841Z414_9LIST|nr:hypothetical protein [Listeria weihenstephanensis]MBC1500010.1 hypothetical protein [Listeria weihenstephanensis]
MERKRKLLGIFKCIVWFVMLLLFVDMFILNDLFPVSLHVFMFFLLLTFGAIMIEIERLSIMVKYHPKEKLVYDRFPISRFGMIDRLERDIKSLVLTKKNATFLTNRLAVLKSEEEKEQLVEEAYKEQERRKIKEIENRLKMIDVLRRMEIEKYFRFNLNLNCTIRYSKDDEYLVYVGCSEYVFKFDKNEIILVDKTRGRSGMKRDF